MRVNRPNEPAYAGIPTFCKVPLALEPSDLAGADVAVVGVPVDEAVSSRPGTRFGPRAVRLADDTGGSPPYRPSIALGVDPFSILRVVDYGDVEVVAGDAEHNSEAAYETVSSILAVGAIPIVLGGDHSISYATVKAAAAVVGSSSLAVLQLDAHADSAEPAPGRPRWSHATPFRLLVDEGHLSGGRLFQLGLRGAWPGPEEFEWARGRGIRWRTMEDVEARGWAATVDEAIDALGTTGPVWLSFDIDVVDPAYAPGTGTPEPGGLTSREALVAVRRIASQVDVAGMDLVEVSPPYDPAGVTAVLAHRLVLEALSGIAVRRA